MQDERKVYKLVKHYIKNQLQMQLRGKVYTLYYRITQHTQNTCPERPYFMSQWYVIWYYNTNKVSGACDSGTP